jgi:hypothetical protein
MTPERPYEKSGLWYDAVTGLYGYDADYLPDLICELLEGCLKSGQSPSNLYNFQRSNAYQKLELCRMRPLSPSN